MKLKSPTEKEVVAAARAFEDVKASQDKLGSESLLQMAGQSRNPGFCGCQQGQRQDPIEFEGVCHWCSKPGHRVSDCRSSKNLKCTACFRLGHIAGAFFCKVRDVRQGHGGIQHSDQQGPGGYGSQQQRLQSAPQLQGCFAQVALDTDGFTPT